MKKNKTFLQKLNKIMKSGRITRVVKLLRDQEDLNIKLKKGKTYGHEKAKRRNRV